MAKRLSVAVIGCGYWGPNLIRNFNSLGDHDMALVCDTDQARLNHMRKLYPQVKTTTRVDDVINDPSIDAVAIATPVRFHYDLARKVLAAGKHTFIEKPMAASVKECEDLIELAEKHKRILMVGHTFLYADHVRKIKEIVASGELGEILYINSRRLNLGLLQKDINVAWDLAPHDIAIILYILGEVPEYVNCEGRAHYAPGIEDVTSMTLSFASGVIAMIQSSWLDPNKVREITFVGKKKMLVYDDIQPSEKIRIYDKRVEAPPHYDTFAEFQYSYHYGDMYAPFIKMSEPLKVECQHFLDCIVENKKPLTDGHNGLEVIRVLEAANKALHKHDLRRKK